MLKAIRFTVIMPVFNERSTIEKIIKKVLEQKNVQLLIVVDDYSTDGTREILTKYKLNSRIRILLHEKNMGKGAAIRTAQPFVSSKYLIIQDADLEYNPSEYKRFVDAFDGSDADVVVGSRFQTGEVRRISFFWHYLGNRFLTLLSNVGTNLNLSDMECCYIAIKSQYFKSLDLIENRFGNQPEMIAKLAAIGCIFYEVSVSYHGRSYAEGKKINYKDGFRALYCIAKYNNPIQKSKARKKVSDSIRFTRSNL